jgi:hypothetical protein
MAKHTKIEYGQLWDGKAFFIYLDQNGNTTSVVRVDEDGGTAFAETLVNT